MKKSFILWGGLLLSLFFAFWLFSYYRSYLLFTPYLYEARFYPVSSSPQEAYEAFSSALKDNDLKTALKYISREKRDYYKELLANEEWRKRQINDKPILRELYRQPCDYENICEETAVYEYDYDLLQDEEREIAGQRVYLEAGRRTLQIRFIKLSPSVWQISEL